MTGGEDVRERRRLRVDEQAPVAVADALDRRGVVALQQHHLAGLQPRERARGALELERPVGGDAYEVLVGDRTRATISPLPGTPTRRPRRRSASSAAPSNIASVAVDGIAQRGAHRSSGALQQRQGASFLLDAPLSEGEEVTVVVDLAEGGPLTDSLHRLASRPRMRRRS